MHGAFCDETLPAFRKCVISRFNFFGRVVCRSFIAVCTNTTPARNTNGLLSQADTFSFSSLFYLAKMLVYRIHEKHYCEDVLRCMPNLHPQKANLQKIRSDLPLFCIFLLRRTTFFSGRIRDRARAPTERYPAPFGSRHGRWIFRYGKWNWRQRRWGWRRS